MKGQLTGVTISGADDLVDPAELARLSGQYPFVEWGVLCSESRSGTPRYPMPSWQHRLSVVLVNNNMSLHLCGALSRRVMAGEDADNVLMQYAPRHAARIQLNGFHQFALPDLLAARSDELWGLILQCNDIRSLDAGAEFARRYSCVKLLWDPSAGTGKSMLDTPAPLVAPNLMGFAGGIGPDNVADVVRHIIEQYRDVGPFWIDMESGVRDERDAFDLDKVEAVLETCDDLRRQAHVKE